LMHVREIGFEPGLRLDSIEQVVTFIQVQQAEFKTGIKELDARHVVPMRGAAMLLLGPTGKGKTWFLVNIGKQGLLQRKRVLHISLEMGEEEVLQRYYQSLFSVTKRQHEVEVPTMEFDDKDSKMPKLEAFSTDTVTPDFTFDSEIVSTELEAHIHAFGPKSRNLIVKRFPSLNTKQIESYLDALEIVEGFIPDLVILDYIGLMKTSARDKRIDLGEEFKSFRGIMIERNMAGVTAQQSSKIGAKAKTVTMYDVAEDWSLTNTADIVLTYSSTDSEHRLGLGRLYVSKARGEQDKFGVLLTQTYALGQFVLESHLLGKDYWDLAQELEDEVEERDDEDDEKE
jgi:KaiC/GvpD/RAD55 family RecA-like ATPase